MIDSTAVEDRCGVCHGNGSTCTTVRRTFEDSEGLGMCHTSFCRNTCNLVVYKKSKCFFSCVK